MNFNPDSRISFSIYHYNPNLMFVPEFSFLEYVFTTENQSPISHPRSDDIITRKKISQLLGSYNRVTPSSEFNGNACCICIETYNVNECVRKLKCGHNFHKKCIDNWLINGSKTCPTCRIDPFEKQDCESV
jgi:hypothetical protein